MKSHVSEKINMERMEMDESANRKIRYPKGIFFIMATELSERFSYYGMRAVLTIYMRNILNYGENRATTFYHVFLLLCYGLPIFWGIISDSWLGKFRTILYVSILFALGNIILALSSIPPLHLPTEALFFAGLLFMAVGTAGMKPCVAPLGGEQFVLPEQSKQLTQFFSVFFFVVTIGNMISTVITPIFRRDISCFGMENCFPLAFGVPAGTMVLAIVIFLCGKRLYNISKPNGNMLVKVTKCVAHALSKRGRKSGVDQHWLDSASDIYDQEIIKDTKGLFRILPYFLPVPMFFALYEQLGSRWTLQATRMKGTIGSVSIKPDQMQVCNAILMFISLPLFNWVVYPVLAKFGLNLRMLQKMVIGGILAAMSFGVAGLVELKMEPTMRIRPAKANTVVTLVNAGPCPVTVWTNSTTLSSYNYTVDGNNFLTLPSLIYANPTTIKVQTVNGKCANIASWSGEMNMQPKQFQSISMFMLSNGSLSVTAYPFEDDYKKSKDGNARIRFIVETEIPTNYTVKPDLRSVKVILTEKIDGMTQSYDLQKKDNLLYSETKEINENVYNVSLQSSAGDIWDLSTQVELLNGGSYNLIINKNSNHEIKSHLTVITPPNDIHILWLLPQYILMAWGEILFIVSGMEFAYTEAPSSMKSVVQAIWHLMNACGNLIVIIAAQNHGHGQGSQALEFFIFAGCMLIDSIIYAVMAWQYKYVAQGGKMIDMR